MIEFANAMQSAGIAPPGNIQADGNLHRFHVEDDRSRSENGWYVLHDDPPAGAFGSWKLGISEKWSGRDHRTFTSEEKARYTANIKAAKKQQEVAREKIHAECRERAVAIWDKAKPSPEDHPYLIRKKVRPYGLRLYKNSLVIPMHDGGGTLHGLQFIDHEGGKKFLSGTSKKEHYHSIGGKPEAVLYLAEGYATAATIHEATGEPVAVCFDAGNIKPVAEALRAQFPDLKLVICADNDRQTEENPGLTKGREAAAAIGGFLAAPELPEGATGSDFNDLFQVADADEVRCQIEAAQPVLHESVQEESAHRQTEKQRWPSPLPPAAMPGLIGDFIKAATMNSEADSAAILITLLGYFAISCGSNPYIMIGDTRHYARVNGVVVGESNNARKGTSVGPVKAVFELVEQSCKVSPGPLSSGEGIVYAVRDAVQEWKIDKKSGSGDWQVTDPGIEDKRLLVIEEEFASSLQATKREGNTLSSIVRTLFDSGNCEPLTKTSRTSCTNAHVGIIAHITLFELKKLLSENDKMNGFGNRFLWICAKRSRLVAFPEPLPESVKTTMSDHIKEAIKSCRSSSKYELTDDARQLWAECYPDLAESREGIAGTIVARAAPYVLRLALVYCLFRKGKNIDVEDIEAALAFWKYADQSANFIFNGTVVQDRNKQKILKCLGDEEKTKSEIRKEAFSGHIDKEFLDGQLEELISGGILEYETISTAGAPKTIYRKTDGRFCAKSVLSSNLNEVNETKNANTPITQGEIYELDDEDILFDEQMAF